MPQLADSDKFQIIYADPPWSYHLYRPQYTRKNNAHRPIRTAASFYNTMSLEEIKSLPIHEIAADNCALFLWVPNPLLPEGFKVIDAWGFKYKTVGFIWGKKYPNSDKLKNGMGHYTRSNAEQCLLAIKGRLERFNHSVYQVYEEYVDAPIERHSKKPDIFRERIEKLFGDVKRIELFARQTQNERGQVLCGVKSNAGSSLMWGGLPIKILIQGWSCWGLEA